MERERRRPSRTHRASNACCADRRFCDRTYEPYFVKLFGVRRKSSHSGKYGRNQFREETLHANCGIAKTTNYFIFYIIRARMSHTVCCNNFVGWTVVELATTVRRLSTSYATGTRVDLRRAYVAYSQKCSAAPSCLASTWRLFR